MATASEAAELKVEGVVEAAENPNSSVTADAAQHEIVEQSKNAGVAAFQFDPDASPAEKRAQAKAVRPSRNSNMRCGLIAGLRR
jgi:hypothetical protein